MALGRKTLLDDEWSFHDRMVIAWLTEKGCLPHYETTSWGDLWLKEKPGDLSADGDFDARENLPMARKLTSRMRGFIRDILDDLLAIAGLKLTHVDLMLDQSRLARWMTSLTGAARSELERIFTDRGGMAIRDTLAVASRRPEGRAEVAFNLENRRAIDYLDDESRIIGRSATDAFRDEIRGALIEGVEQGENMGQIAKRIGKIDETFVPHKAQMIARTETAFAHMEATRQGWEQSGVVAGKQFVCAPECCEWCQAVQKKYPDTMTLQIRQPLFRRGDVLAAEFMNAKGEPVIRRMTFDYEGLEQSGGLLGPPIHPNCRCDLRPVLAEEFA